MSGYIVARRAPERVATLLDAFRWIDVMDAAWSLRSDGAPGWSGTYRL